MISASDCVRLWYEDDPGAALAAGDGRLFTRADLRALQPPADEYGHPWPYSWQALADTLNDPTTTPGGDR